MMMRRRAYSFASPQIRQKFPDKSIFFEMVKRGYTPIYRPGNFAFGRSKIDGNTVVQEVLISASGWQGLDGVVFSRQATRWHLQDQRRTDAAAGPRGLRYKQPK
jgi:alpha-glucuronidase